MFYIFGFYKFKRLSGLKILKKTFEENLKKLYVRGTIIFSKEGINGTISGKKNNVQQVINILKNICKIKKLTLKIFLQVTFSLFTEVKLKLKMKLYQLELIFYHHKSQITQLIPKNGICC